MKIKVKDDTNLFSWEKHLEDFLLTKKVEGCRDRTIKDYEYHVNQFFKEYPYALEDQEKLQFSVRCYFTTDCAPGTFNIRRSNLKAFFNFLLSEGIIQKNPISFQKRKDEEKKYQIPQDGLIKLLSLPNKSTFAGLRDYCLMLITLDTGIRPQEALSLLIDDINLNSLEITVRKEIAKTNTSRTLPISAVTVMQIRKIIKARPSNWTFRTPIFCSFSGEAMLESSWSHQLKKYSKILDLSITPYSLRHCFALFYLRNGGNVFTLQRTMGHTDLNMTKRYLALTNQDLLREHQFASPINFLVEKKRIKKLI